MPIRLRFFGPFFCRVGEEALPPLRSRRGYSLLASLILRQGRPVRREVLIESLWPESSTKSGQENLRRTLTDLRRALGTEAHRVLSDGHQSVRFVLDEDVTADVVHFDAFSARWEKTGDPDAASEAIALYRGPLLEGFDAEWISGERAAREELCREMLESLVRRALHSGDAPRALTLARRAERLDPLNAVPQRLLYEALAAVGDVPAAQRAYREFRERLYRETNQEPDGETRALYQRLQEQAARPVKNTPPLREHPTTSALPTPPLRIPFPVSELVGREAETQEVASLLLTHRLVTLTGSGGIGKTRLALSVATRAALDFPAGIWFVELSPVTDPAQVVSTLGHVLEVREQEGQSLTDAILEHLRGRRLLLILDNAEHVLASCAALTARLLETLPELRVLATSRMPLGVAGEQVWRVPSLACPDPATPPSLSLPDSLLDYAGPRLFVTRALSASSVFVLTERNAPAILQICARLDGIPLALELAAARLASLSAEQIAARLENVFRLLTTGPRTALPRHQTLRALVDWSYDLLSDREKAILGRLSVFVGGWTLEAAESVCGFAPLDTAEVLDLLTGLVDKSLVLAEATEGTMRYRMLETLRQYGVEKRNAGGETAEVRQRHRDFFLALAEETNPKLVGPDAGIWLRRLESEHDNLRAALAFSLEDASGGEVGLRLGVALKQFWQLRGHATEGRDLFRALLSQPGAQTRTRSRADALSSAAGLAWTQGDYSSARSLYEESLALRRELDDKIGVANCLYSLGLTDRSQGDHSSARSLHEKGMTLYRELGDKHGIARSLGDLGLLAHEQGDRALARSLQEESVALYRELGDKYGIATSLNNLGNTVRTLGDYSSARSFCEESLALRKELGDRNGVAYALLTLGFMAFDQGDYSMARGLHEECLVIFRELGIKHGIASTLNHLGLVALIAGDYSLARSLFTGSLLLWRELNSKRSIAFSVGGFAALAAREERLERAVRLWGAVFAFRDASGYFMSPQHRQGIEDQLPAMREALGDATFSAAWEAGHTMTWEQAAAYALEE